MKLYIALWALYGGLEKLQLAYAGGGMPVIVIENVHGFEAAMDGQSLKQGLSKSMPGYHVSVTEMQAEKTPSPLNGLKAKCLDSKDCHLKRG